MLESNQAGTWTVKPEDILLTIEVADHTLSKDRNVKGVIYAKARIREYWIINLVERELECYTDPTSEGVYDIKRTYHIRNTFDHALFGTISVAALIP